MSIPTIDTVETTESEQDVDVVLYVGRIISRLDIEQGDLVVNICQVLSRQGGRLVILEHILG